MVGLVSLQNRIMGGIGLLFFLAGIGLLSLAAWQSQRRRMLLAACGVLVCGVVVCLWAWGNFIYWSDYYQHYCLQFPANCG
jgi:4-amino-4-deoxy-L-arabinose transferase-like glycosyltransferase